MTYSERIYAEGRAEGRAEGLVEGQRKTFLKQLAQKFGALEPTVVERIQSADPDAIEAWLDRVLVASQLSAIFES